MKIEQTKGVFKPVTITLESQLEVDVLMVLGASVYGKGPVRKVVDDLYKKLVFFTNAPIKPFEGSLVIKKEFADDI